MSAINSGAVLEALNDKMDRDGRNTDTTSGADVVIAYQVPTAANNYTWYRLYKSGWIEQGGYVTVSSGSSNTVGFLLEMVDTNYCALISSNSSYYGAGEANNTVLRSSTTYITVNNGSHVESQFSWEVKGMAVQS